MQSLANGLYAEDFFYGYPYDNVVDPLPPEFDYEGAALTNGGLITCLPADFTLEYGRDPSVNPDAALAYGGSPDSNDYYLRFPVLSWEGAAGLFLSLDASAAAVLTFDRAWSGYVGDTFSVVVNGMELLTVTGSAGYPWTRSSVTLPAGHNEIAFVLRCAPYTAATVRGGTGQPAAVVDLYRFLRITNLSITNTIAVPTADHQRLAMIAESTFSDGGQIAISVTSGQVAMDAQADLLWPKKLSGALLMEVDASLSTGAGSFVGKYGVLPMAAEATLSVVAAVENDIRPTDAGFGITGSAQLVVESTLAPAPQDYTRPLMLSRVTMTRPVFVAGRPVSPLATSETEVEYAVEASVLSKINPISQPGNLLPCGPTYRWLSLGAHFDVTSDRLVEWFDTTGAGPSWTQPGLPAAFAPAVGNYSIKNRSGVQTVRYPAVHFDATHGDHLLADLPVTANGMTFVMVGTFARYRGALDDSCPIIDYAGDPAIDYSTQVSPVRGVFPWAADGPSIYLGLVPANRQEPTVSKIAYAAGSYRTTDSVVLSDDTPMVLVYSLSSTGSFLMAIPLITGQTAAAGRMLAELPGVVPGTDTSFALGKARGVPPANGTFSTATMSLLEVAYYDRALLEAEASTVTDFLVGLYSPVDQNGGPTTSFIGSGDLDTEQLLIYANAPEQPIALISGSKTTVTSWYLSDSASSADVSALTSAGVPLVLLSNRDYTAIIDAGEQTR